jgi:ribosomal peptide maturation radical SAM protein 1
VASSASASDFRALLAPADALIVVPPFAGVERPALGPHLLQACARARGFEVSILYASLMLAAELGDELYQALAYAPSTWLLGERIFAAEAFPGLPLLGRGAPLDAQLDCGANREVVDAARIRALAERVPGWLDGVASAVASGPYRVVGCTTTFEQTAASFAFLRRLKRLRPDVITLLGGANCEGPMVDGLAALGGPVDHLFSGESEESFVELLAALRNGGPPAPRVIRGRPCLQLDALPTPSFDDYYRQLEILPADGKLRQSGHVWLPYETSRGCWWGEKHHCRFCGVNGTTMRYRAKSAERVIADLRQLLDAHPTKKVCMVDNVMPRQYARTLLPALARELPAAAEIFYEVRPNLRLEEVIALKRAGVSIIQPGIEALDDALLRRMNKGVDVRQVLALLRYCASVELDVSWNLLYAFPGDDVGDYRATLELMALIQHLSPPSGPFHLSIDRFSPYFDAPAAHGISNVRPLPAAADVLPDGAAAEAIAYHFLGEYRSGARERPEIVDALHAAVEGWQNAWEGGGGERPVLYVAPVGEERFLLADTRGLPATRRFQFVDRAAASAALAGGRTSSPGPWAWALESRVVVSRGAWYVPLATAAPEVLSQFQPGASRMPARRGVPDAPRLEGAPCA